MTVALVRVVMAKFGLAENIENKNTCWDFHGLRTRQMVSKICNILKIKIGAAI